MFDQFDTDNQEVSDEYEAFITDVQHEVDSIVNSLGLDGAVVADVSGVPFGETGGVFQVDLYPVGATGVSRNEEFDEVDIQKGVLREWILQTTLKLQLNQNLLRLVPEND